MFSYLKQSTNSQTRIIGPFVDDTDFKTLETGLTITNTDVKLSANGGSATNKNSGGGTHISNGMYALTFDSTDTATVGELNVSIAVSGALVVVAKFVVLEESTYDALFGASATAFDANGGVNVTQISGDATAADNLEAILDGTGANLDINTFTVSTNSIAWNAVWDAEIQSEVNDALVAVGLDHLLSAAVSGTDITDNSIIAQLVSKSGTADWDSYNNTTDSLEAQADGANISLLQTTTIATLSSQTSFTLTAGSADDDAYNDLTMIITDQSTATQKAVVGILDYTGSTKSVTLHGAPEFTVQAGDIVDIIASPRRAHADIKAINASTEAATQLARSAETILYGTVNDANTTPTTTLFASPEITEATADHYIGRIVIFTSGALQDQARDISDYEYDGVNSEGKITVSTAMTDTPADGDTFIIV